MNFIFIYGPSAVGKLTVAKELAKITKYTLIDNHKTIDFITEYFPFGSASFIRLNDIIKASIYSELISKDSSFIVTYCFTGKEDDKQYISKLFREFRQRKIRICLVRLECPEKELLKRVRMDSRKETKKLTSRKKLKERLKRNNYYSNVPNYESLVIDNTSKSAKAVANLIKKYYQL